jgi:hypothetical protein
MVDWQQLETCYWEQFELFPEQRLFRRRKEVAIFEVHPSIHQSPSTDVLGSNLHEGTYNIRP